MKRYGLLPVYLAALVAVVALGGCATVGQKMTSEPPSVTIAALAAAGCTTDVRLDVGGGTGQVGGGFTSSFHFEGACDPTRIKTLKEFGGSLPPVEGPH